jgi:hypothetical protein
VVIAKGEPEQAKALLCLLIAEPRVNGRADIQPTYRVLTPDRFLTAGGLRNVRKSGDGWFGWDAMLSREAKLASACSLVATCLRS